MEQRGHQWGGRVESGESVSVRYVIRGRLDTPSYLAFVAERARWFGLAGVARAEQDAIVVTAYVPEAMVGALEMACLLGPIDALVDSISCVPTTERAERTFSVA